MTAGRLATRLDVTVVESSAAPPRSSSVYARLPSRPQPSAGQQLGEVSRYALVALLALAMVYRMRLPAALQSPN
jgi:hypothetical protein